MYELSNNLALRLQAFDGILAACRLAARRRCGCASSGRSSVAPLSPISLSTPTDRPRLESQGSASTELTSGPPSELLAPITSAGTGKRHEQLKGKRSHPRIDTEADGLRQKVQWIRFEVVDVSSAADIVVD